MCSRKRFWVQDVRVVGKNFELSNYDAYLPSCVKIMSEVTPTSGGVVV